MNLSKIPVREVARSKDIAVLMAVWAEISIELVGFSPPVVEEHQPGNKRLSQSVRRNASLFPLTFHLFWVLGRTWQCWGQSRGFSALYVISGFSFPPFSFFKSVSVEIGQRLRWSPCLWLALGRARNKP